MLKSPDIIYRLERFVITTVALSTILVGCARQVASERANPQPKSPIATPEVKPVSKESKEIASLKWVMADGRRGDTFVTFSGSTIFEGNTIYVNYYQAFVPNRLVAPAMVDILVNTKDGGSVSLRFTDNPLGTIFDTLYLIGIDGKDEPIHNGQRIQFTRELVESAKKASELSFP